MNGGNMERKRLRAVIYCRVGNESQVDRGIALTTQNVLLRHQAARENIDIVGEVQVCEKGITLNRPGWHEALNLAAKSKADAIFVTKYDRVARGSSFGYFVHGRVCSHSGSLRQAIFSAVLWKGRTVPRRG